MSQFDTVATVGDQGQLRIAGVPFAPGTEVEVTIREKAAPDPLVSPAEGRAAHLFAALDKAGNAEPVGPLRREELYDRKVLR